MKKLLTLIIPFLLATNALATIVEFDTSVGKFKVNLYDNRTPKTVSNFLNYVEQGDYQNVIIHRSVTDFVIQGGGYNFNGSMPLDVVTKRGEIENEPVFSNVRGTIAMAKIGGRPDSASSQWFFNLMNNSSILDPQNGGFTVFGEVMDDGMSIVDEIADVQIFNLGGAPSITPIILIP